MKKNNKRLDVKNKSSFNINYATINPVNIQAIGREMRELKTKYK